MKDLVLFAFEFDFYFVYLAIETANGGECMESFYKLRHVRFINLFKWMKKREQNLSFMDGLFSRIFRDAV